MARKNNLIEEAKSLLPKSTVIPNNHEAEIQIDGIAYLFQFENKSIDEPRYGCWHFVEQEDLRIKNPRGRPKKTDVIEKTPNFKCNLYDDKEIARIEASTGLVFKELMSIDGIEVPIFKKNK